MMIEWVSFAKVDGALGVIVVENCNNLIDALVKINRAGINPGGEALSFTFDLDTLPEDGKRRMTLIPKMQLLSRERVEEFTETITSGEAFEEDPVTFNAVVDCVCEECNEELKS